MAKPSVGCANLRKSASVCDDKARNGYTSRRSALKPRPHQQQCRSNIRLCRKNRSTCSIWQCCFDPARP